MGGAGSDRGGGGGAKGAQAPHFFKLMRCITYILLL